ncbi:MAG: hypothetical protein ACR2OK_01045 [Parvibaculales bacterium]
MRKTFLVLVVAMLALPVAAPVFISDAQAQALPKCRNVAGYEPKATCQARNERAQWQAQQTARMTAQLVAEAMARQAAAEQANESDEGFMDMISGVIGSVVETVSDLF